MNFMTKFCKKKSEKNYDHKSAIRKRDDFSKNILQANKKIFI